MEITKYDGGSEQHLDRMPLMGQQLPFGFASDSHAEASVFDYFRVLQKRVRVILLITVLSVIVAGLITMRMTPLYRATGEVAISHENDIVNFKDSNSNAQQDWDTELDTQVKIMSSDSMLLQAGRQLRLNTATAEKVPVTSDKNSAQVADGAAIIASGLQVKVVPHTRIIDISYMGPNPRVAADVVNTLIQSYIEQNYKTKYESTMQASDWLSKQLAELQVKVETSQQKLVDFQKQAGIVGIDEKQNVITEKLDQLGKDLTSAETDRIQKQSVYELAASSRGESASSNPMVERLRTQENDLQAQLAQLTTRYGPSHPKVLEANNELQQIQKSISEETGKQVGQAHNDYLAALQRERLLRAAFEQQKAEANQLNESSIQYNLLKRDVDSNRQLYEGLLQKLKEAGVSASLKSSNVRIVDVARVPSRPARPNLPLNLVVAFAIGIAGGIGCAFVLEAADNTVRTPEQLDHIRGISALGMIPLHRDMSKTVPVKTLPAPDKGAPPTTQLALIPYKRPTSRMAEAYRAFRTSILLSSPGSPRKVLLFTSSLPQEGKSTTVLNTGVVLAQTGARVLLVDADLRRPSLHRLIGASGQNGLTDILNGSVGLDRWEHLIVQSRSLANLSVLPAGPRCSNPAELLSGEVMRKLLVQCREMFDYVIIDTPPALAVTDAILLSLNADAVVLVVRSGSTTKQAVRQMCDLFEKTRVHLMGALINAVDTTSPEYNYYYSGRYGYKYSSYGYYEEDAAAAKR